MVADTARRYGIERQMIPEWNNADGTAVIMPSTWHSTIAPGSAARASAAEHNHNKSHVDAVAEQHDAGTPSEEEMSDDMRMAKKRRGVKGKFTPIAENGESLWPEYDLLDAENGVDEFTDRRRSKPPARTGKFAHDGDIHADSRGSNVLSAIL
jgi:hypothetical protein